LPLPFAFHSFSLVTAIYLPLARACTSRHRRWLTHSISDYYGLDSKSVTVGNPARRVVYVRVKQAQKQKPKQKQKQMEQNLPSRLVLPPPLWEMF
jgi:hypothetical protein